MAISNYLSADTSDEKRGEGRKANTFWKEQKGARARGKIEMPVQAPSDISAKATVPVQMSYPLGRNWAEKTDCDSEQDLKAGLSRS